MMQAIKGFIGEWFKKHDDMNSEAQKIAIRDSFQSTVSSLPRFTLLNSYSEYFIPPNSFFSLRCNFVLIVRVLWWKRANWLWGVPTSPLLLSLSSECLRCHCLSHGSLLCIHYLHIAHLSVRLFIGIFCDCHIYTPLHVYAQLALPSFVRARNIANPVH